ncbi:MAG TPA: 16S rRNA (cytosine(1402)-N(4))-methyltransferase RsmH [Candidatus Paceibacterota bacterium]|jgi:16S rRNA (cytosine1402-N4)-methyltransferase|nr:16S rRNA (cytosine(1402)-N(4))-methyltransferase RsmH [Candidatus Paceibacterota bacterium]
MHKSVLLEQSIELLDIHKADVIVDGTFGGGGHSKAILDRFGREISLICVDLDEEAQKRFADEFSPFPNATFVHANFKDASEILIKAGKQKANKVLLDLGTSTFQLLADTRGFSFQSDTPLQMTFSNAGSHTGFTARDIVNTWDESSIADIIYYYGGERSAKKVAHAIIVARATHPIETSNALAGIIEKISPRRGKLHPATKTFQALRIAVNDELRTLETALNNWWELLADRGRIVVITFHSLEDRIVKRWMRSNTPDLQKRVITKKPLIPTKLELQANPRARSAKLRAVEKLL